ncbi:pimeloyl-ACP methyl ester carboxylesterase [Knoellia remsis]|uniref:Pimeloyl-ACP methyl ester carboxylesterase n=1 Tax=Knoellia remsis TaxID=407159 RepID=A0A2T0UGX1_9MICO|nr:alpha/beta hydrolase [Knoellia remsis]PRY57067.1 pimeloyl-ACP methyl ester carboxylesterase [Knoellia remsis]
MAAVASSRRDIQPSRGRRWLRRLAIALFVVLVLDKVVGMARDDATVGRWVSASGRDAYVTAYDRTWQDLPKPTSVREVPTTFGIARVYEWTRPQVAGRTPVVLLPGRSSGSPMWAANLPGIIAERPVYAMDAIGDAGLSVQSTPLSSFADIAQWVDEALAALKVEKAHVVGHSFGGASAAALATTRPGRIASLTLLEPVMTFESMPVSTMLWAALLSVPAPQSWKDRALAEIGGTTVEEVRRRTPMSEMINLGSRNFRAALPTPKVATDEALRGWTFPVYVAIASDKSLAGGEEAAARARSLLPNATVKVWPDTTHSLPMQVAAPLDAELVAFWAAAD